MVRIVRMCVVVTMLTLALAPPVAAAGGVAIDGTVTGQHGPPDFSAPGCPDWALWRFPSEGSGELSPFGPVDYVLTQCTRAEDDGSYFSEGTITFTFTGGDTLVIAQEMRSLMVGEFDPDPDGFTLNATWTVAGGTGRFAGATGAGSMDGLGDIPDGVAVMGIGDGLARFNLNGTLIMHPVVTGMVLVNAMTDGDVGPLADGTVIDLGTTPQFNIRVETAPATVGSVGFSVVDSGDRPVRFRLDGQPRENFPPYAAGGDWAIGNYLPMTLGVGTYTLTATAYTGGSLTGTAGPSYSVTFTVAEPFTASYSGEVIAITTDPELVADRCEGPSWGYVTFGGSGASALLGSFTALAENCSYVGALPDGTIGPNGTYGEGVLTLTAENGDVVHGTYTGGVSITPLPVTRFTDSYTLAGGTGRFAAAVGSGVEVGTADFSAGLAPGAPFTVTMEGVIAY